MSTTSIHNSTTNSSRTYIQAELGRILHQHDPNAIRIYDFVQHVKVFQYNTNELHWEINPQIEGNLFAYEKQQMINNQRSSVFAFAVINKEEHLIEEIPLNISAQADKQYLFYELVRNNQCQVYSLCFLNEHECQRCYTFIQRSIQHTKEQQSRTSISNTPQINGQVTPSNVSRQQTPVHIRHVSTPVNNVNSNTEDPTSSLKRLLNISKPNELPVPSEQPIQLLPPSAFQSLSSERDTQFPREHIRHVFFHLLQHDEHFLNIIQHACHTHQSQ